MLQPVSYPAQLGNLRKYELLRRQADEVNLGRKCAPVRQTVAFRDQCNAVGLPLRANKLRGEDSFGFDDGSKNSVLNTYLTDAHRFGAEMCVT